MNEKPITHRPSILPKPTHIHHKTHTLSNPPPAIPYRILDRIIITIGYAGLFTYLYQNSRRLSFSPLQIASTIAGSLTLGYSLFDLGRKGGIIDGASIALRNHDERGESDTAIEEEVGEEADWRGEFTGQEFSDLKTVEKIGWLRNEEQRIREIMKDEQVACGEAYINKEQAYAAYEKHGGYGGEDWKTYAGADSKCQRIYKDYRKKDVRLGYIRKEIKELSALL